MRYLMLLAAGLYVAYRFEKRAEMQKNSKIKLQEEKTNSDMSDMMDETLEDSFPASDPPGFSPTGYHH